LQRIGEQEITNGDKKEEETIMTIKNENQKVNDLLFSFLTVDGSSSINRKRLVVLYVCI
jgi:hypothetical protein